VLLTASLAQMVVAGALAFALDSVAAILVLAAPLLFMTASATAEVFFLKEDLEVSDAVYGVIFGAWTLGMITGALVVGSASRIACTAAPSPPTTRCGTARSS
jgi:hypothetical protein